MTTTDKAKNTAQQAKGKLKEAAGEASGNDDLRAKGKADQTKASLKQAGEKVKDAFKELRKAALTLTSPNPQTSVREPAWPGRHRWPSLRPFFPLAEEERPASRETRSTVPGPTGAVVQVLVFLLFDLFAGGLERLASFALHLVGNFTDQLPIQMVLGLG